MISQNFKLKKIFILSNDLIVFNALTDNLPSYFTQNNNDASHIVTNKYGNQFQIEIGDKIISIEKIDLQNQILSHIDKMDLLFIDCKINPGLIPAFRANILVNITGSILADNEIIFTKPIMLHDLISIVIRNYHDNTIFCCVNSDWIYNENASNIRSIDQVITLTDKENILFKNLLEIDQFKADKDYLRHKVWNYHQDSESSTVETHLYKLKQKLPLGLLEIKGSYCQLNIESL